MGEGDMHFPSNCCEWQNVKNVGNVKEPPMVSMCSVGAVRGENTRYPS